MGKTFRQRVHEARAHVKLLSPVEAKQIIDGRGAMVIDVREAWEIAHHGTIQARATSRVASWTSRPTLTFLAATSISRIAARRSSSRAGQVARRRCVRRCCRRWASPMSGSSMAAAGPGTTPAMH